MWCLACIASYLLEWFLLSLHKQLWICHAVRPVFVLFHPGIMCLPYIKVVIVSIMHEWVLKSEFYSFFLSVWPHNAKSIKLKETGKALDDGGPSEQLKRRFSTDSTPPSSQQDSQDNARLDSQRSCVDDEHISPTPPSQVLALTWQCDMWLHVAYDVYLVMLLIRVNCICLVNTLYLWIWHAFLFLVHTTSMC